MNARRRARVPIPLTIAGSDPTGGAGLEADLKVFAALGLSGCAVASALTTQDTRVVHAVHAVPPALLRRRLSTLLQDVRVDGLKTGLLPSAAAVRVVRDAVRDFAIRSVVVDPVLVSSSGMAFLGADGRRALWNDLLPLATVVTPNVAEAALLLGCTASDVLRDVEHAATRLLECGAGAVLLKGGHGRGASSVDVLVDRDGARAFRAPRLRGARADVHGTGCALSAALLAHLVSGASLDAATRSAKALVLRAIRRARRVGAGRLALDLRR